MEPSSRVITASECEVSRLDERQTLFWSHADWERLQEMNVKVIYHGRPSWRSLCWNVCYWVMRVVTACRKVGRLSLSYFPRSRKAGVNCAAHQWPPMQYKVLQSFVFFPLLFSDTHCVRVHLTFFWCVSLFVVCTAALTIWISLLRHEYSFNSMA